MTTITAGRRLLTDFAAANGVAAVGGGLVTRALQPALEIVGVRRRGCAEPAVGTDRWHIGSCGKSVTAALYGRLVETGKAEWGVPVAHLLPDISDTIHPAWFARTIDEVFRCRAGVGANLPRSQMTAAYRDTRPLSVQRLRVAEAALHQPPRRPGRFLYSNLAYIVGGAVIDHLAGAPYERALHTLLLEPLGARSLGFGAPPEIWGHGPRIHLGDLSLFRGVPAPPADPTSDNPAVLSSAGTMHLSLGDWARFLRLFVTEGGGVLEPATLDHLLTVPEGPGPPMAMGWMRADRLDRVSFGMQGSNTMWSATALLDDRRRRIAMMVCNDGRTRVLRRCALAARDLLEA